MLEPSPGATASGRRRSTWACRRRVSTSSTGIYRRGSVFPDPADASAAPGACPGASSVAPRAGHTGGSAGIIDGDPVDLDVFCTDRPRWTRVFAFLLQYHALDRIRQRRGRSDVLPHGCGHVVDIDTHDVIEPLEANRMPSAQVERVGMPNLVVACAIVKVGRATTQPVALAVVFLATLRPRCAGRRTHRDGEPASRATLCPPRSGGPSVGDRALPSGRLRARAVPAGCGIPARFTGREHESGGDCGAGWYSAGMQI